MSMLRFSVPVVWMMLAIVLSTLALSVQAIVAPNHFLGTCLTDEWVASMEQTLGVDSLARDSRNRFLHPFLHASIKNPLTRIHDPRTAAADAFASSCLPSSTRIYGDGAVVDAATGAVRDQGRTNGTLVVESATWITHGLTTLVFAILAREVYGIPVTIFADSKIALLNERMSSVGAGICTPTHVNLEVWSHPSVLLDSYAAGDMGYVGRSGLYTTTQFVSDSANTTKHANPLYADYWKGYTLNDELIDAVPVSALRNNTAFFPPREVTCANGTFSCTNSCSKSRACIEREAQGKECMVVVLMYGTYARGYTQSVLTHLNFPTYFCFIGYDGVQNYALDAHARGIPVLFYHYEPDLFHVAHPGVFTRVFLPRALPERVILNTGKFGDSDASDNPVDVDYPTSKLVKFAASALSESTQVSQFVAKFSISELQMNSLLARYNLASAKSSATDPTFQAACSWVKENYVVWTKWLDRKPLCELRTHAHYKLSGCQTEAATFETYRTITFEWNIPDPENATIGYNCDGGLQQLPPPLKTSRSCEWIEADPTRWQSWMLAKPLCDSSFYMYNVTACDPAAKRTVNYWWLLPDPTDPDLSHECHGGDKLPADIRVECDFMPTDAPAFLVVLVLDLAILILLVAAIGFVVYHRNLPIIKRSQWEFLALFVFGGVVMCVAALLYAGKPTRFLCGARPVSIALGFTIIFGALFVKSLRVYRVFMKASMKKATVTTKTMAKVLAALVVVDVLILGVWFAVDFPEPTIELVAAKEFRGEIDRISCHSTSFIFNALLLFWKAIVLIMGICASFLIRNVSSDFQESIWMFASSVMVLLGCLVILPLAYLVEMPAGVFYVFLAGCLLLCTAVVMAFMLVPKIPRLRVEAASSSNSSSTQGSAKVADSNRTRSLVAKSAYVVVSKPSVIGSTAHGGETS